MTEPTIGDHTGAEPRYRPFSNGTMYTDWAARNCDECAKGVDALDDDAEPCAIERAIIVACNMTGTVPEWTARRMGLLDAMKNAAGVECCGRCLEFVQIEVRR